MIQIIERELIVLLNIAEYISFLYIFYGYRIKKARTWKNIGEILAIMVIIVATQWNIDVESMLEMVEEVFIIALVIVVYENYTIRQVIQAEVTAILFTALLQTCSANVFMLFFKEYGVQTMLTLIFANVSMWLYYGLLGRHLEVESLSVYGKVWGGFNVTLMLLWLMYSFFTFVSVNALMGIEKVMGHYLIFFGGIALCGLDFLLIYYINMDKVHIEQRGKAEQMQEAQKRYFEGLLEKEKDTRKFRHDLLNEMAILKCFIEKKDFATCKSYLEEIADDLSEINGRIYTVGNDYMDIMINYYLLPIRENCDIKVIGIVSEELNISNRIISTVTANLLKNAVEAVEKLPEGTRGILFKVEEGEKFLKILVENTIREDMRLPSENKIFTSKNDKQMHGFGLQNVKEAVERSHGTMDYIYGEHNFGISVFMKKSEKNPL